MSENWANTMDTAERRYAPGPIDHAGYRILPGRWRSYLTVLPGLIRDPPGYLLQAARRYGGVVALSPRRIHLVSHPDHVKHVLQDNHPNYLKGPRYKVLKPLMGEGLLSSDGELWRRQRRLIQPAFHRTHHSMMAGIIVASTERMLDGWNTNASRGKPFDARGELILLTLDILLKSMFGADLKGHEEELREAILEVEKHMDLVQAVNPVRLPDWFPTASHRRLQKAVRTLDSFIFRIVAERQNNSSAAGDLVSLLVAARDDDTGEAMSDRQLRDELVTMLQAGHDTVSDAIAWTWYLLARNPGAQERIEQEVDSALGGRIPGLEDLPNLPYTNMVILESMRLYPPAWLFARTPISADEIDGYHIPANSLVVMSPYVTHRLPELWENPETFDPERFSPERSEGRPRFAYFPFGAGPRQCIGGGMAMLEAQLIVAMAAQRYRLLAAPGLAPGLKTRISLSPDCTLWLTPSIRSRGVQ